MCSTGCLNKWPVSFLKRHGRLIGRDHWFSGKTQSSITRFEWSMHVSHKRNEPKNTLLQNFRKTSAQITWQLCQKHVLQRTSAKHPPNFRGLDKPPFLETLSTRFPCWVLHCFTHETIRDPLLHISLFLFCLIPHVLRRVPSDELFPHISSAVNSWSSGLVSLDHW